MIAVYKPFKASIEKQAPTTLIVFSLIYARLDHDYFGPSLSQTSPRRSTSPLSLDTSTIPDATILDATIPDAINPDKRILDATTPDRKILPERSTIIANCKSVVVFCSSIENSQTQLVHI